MGISKNTRIVLIIVGFSLLAFLILNKNMYEQFTEKDTPNKSVDLVIARYKEDLLWLNYLKKYKFRKVIIYNKGNTFKPSVEWDSIEIIPMPNVGVCDHTYLHHIITKYHELADITIFLPGSSDLPNKRWRMEDTIYRAFKFGLPTMYVYDVGNAQKFEYSFEIIYHKVADKQNFDTNTSYFLARAPIRPFGKWYEYYLPKTKCPYITYYGVFSLSRDTVQKKPITFYNTFIEQLKYETFPESAHYIERSWASFFHPQPKNELKDM